MGLLTLVASVLIFALLVLAHEFGHFIAAKQAGIGVREFSIGFGPRLGGWSRGGTLYSLRAIPLGGFTIMVGSEPEEEPAPDAYKVKTVGQRSLAIAAGPLMNFVLTIVLFGLMFAVFGLPKEVNYASTAIGQVLPGYPADKAGLLPGDVLLSIDGQPLADWRQFDQAVSRSLGRQVDLTYRRGSEVLSVVITPTTDPQVPSEGMIGVGPTILYERIGIGRSIVEGFTETWRVLAAWVTSLADYIARRAPLDLAGPVMTVRYIGTTARSGLPNLMYLAGFLSLNIGLFNLLPLPALDGGRLVFLAYEGLTRRKPDPRKESFIHFIGFAALIVLMLLITYRDILRL